MKMFRDYAAKKKFASLYDALEPKQQSLFANIVREAADEKIISMDDSLTEFYLTEKDVEACFNRIPRSI